MLSPNQCSHVWRGSLSLAIILKVIPSLICTGPSKWDMPAFQIQWILMQPLRALLTHACVSMHVCKYVQRKGQRGSAGLFCNNTNSQKKTSTGPPPFPFHSLLFCPVDTVLKICNVLKCHAHIKVFSCSSWRDLLVVFLFWTCASSCASCCSIADKRTDRRDATVTTSKSIM